MKKLLLLSALSFAAIPVAAAYAGEGGGPDFPGLRSPSFSVTTNDATGAGSISAVIRHSADAGYAPRDSDPASSLYTPNTPTWRMLQSVSPG